MQCCGTPFRTGGLVEWTLCSVNDIAWLTDVVGVEIARSIDYCEEHHGRLPEEAPVTKGVVTRIYASRCHFAPRARGRELYPVPGSGHLSVVPGADGWQSEKGGLRFNGYIVDLDVEAGLRAG